MSVAETAGSVRYEHERPAPGDLSLSADEVRRLTLYSQGFLGAAAKRGGVTGVLRRVSAVHEFPISDPARSHELVAHARLGGVTGVLRRVSAVQLDTISVLARSHELLPYARLGRFGRDTVEWAYWPAT